MIAENEVDSAEVKFTDIEDPGYHLPRGAIDRYVLWLDRWGVLPDELDRQDIRIVEDIELRCAMKSQITREYFKRKAEERENNDGSL